MGGAINYSFIAAITSTLKSYMLKPEDYDALLKSTSVDGVYEILQRTYYKICLSDLREKKEIESFERRLYEDYFNILNKIYRTCPRKCIRLVDAIYLRHELYALKMILRALVAGLSTEAALQLVIPIGKYSPDKCRSILESKSIQTAIDSVEEPSLRQALTNVFKQQRGLSLSYLLEATIDRHSLIKIWRSLFPESDRFARRILGKMIDLFNIIFILRSKYLDLEANFIRSFTIPVYHYLSTPELERVIQVPTARDAVQLLTLGHYGKLITRASFGLAIDEAISEIEMNFDRYTAQECFYSFQGFRFHAGLIIGYLMLKFNEISDIRAILFGKANKMPADDIRRKLILHQHVAS
ncbi:MAG: V-type ATPase subunit [archaeon]|nr:V-type ATPase subunit [archaeon]